jgi:hypothetical protein
MATHEEVRTGRDFPSLRFFEAIRDALNNDPEFARATRLFDGSVLLNIGKQSIWMKWYRGQVIDLHEGIDLLGFTFSLTAPEDVWRDIIDLPRTSYKPWAKLFNFGEIAMGGDIVAATRVQEATFIMAGHIHDIGNGGGA